MRGLIVIVILGLLIYWFALQYRGHRPAKWQKRAEGIRWVALYIVGDIKAAAKPKPKHKGSVLTEEEINQALKEMEENLGPYDE